jgi:hypothetical protein
MLAVEYTWLVFDNQHKHPLTSPSGQPNVVVCTSYSGGPRFDPQPQRLASLIEVLRGFLQSLQANARIVPYN